MSDPAPMTVQLKLLREHRDDWRRIAKHQQDRAERAEFELLACRRAVADARREATTTIYLVIGFDVGGNSGEVIVRAFANEADAEHYAEHAKERKHNRTFWPGTGAAFDIESVEVVESLADVADELGFCAEEGRP